VEVGTGGKPPPLRDRQPLREGFGDPHNTFAARLTNGDKFTIFFDYGCPAVYCSERLARKLKRYASSKPATMSGVGGRGPTIGQDVVVTGQFATVSNSSTNGWSDSFSVAAGVVPDDTFPADLVLGKSIFHKWGVSCHGDIRRSEKETVTLRRYTGIPALQPVDRIPRAYSTAECLNSLRTHTRWEEAYMTTNTVTAATAIKATDSRVQWSKDTPTNDDRINGYLREYQERFPGLFDPAKRRTEAISKLSKVEHAIDTGDNAPYRQAPRRYSPAQEQAIRDFVRTHDGNLIRRSKSPWASASHLVPKKHVGMTTMPSRNDPTIIWRFCCDFRELNNRTKKHAHPLPNTMDQIQRAAGHRFYAFIDLKDGFWHIRIAEKDREKTAFLTPNGLYEWCYMPFGLTNAPATFQALMEEILEPFRQFTSGLLDDIAVWADTEAQLHERLLLVFARLEEYGMLLNTRKTSLFVRSGVFLGFVINEDGITADPAKVAAVRDRPMPTTTTEVRGFVNAAGYFRHLIENYSEKSGLLTDLCTGPKGAPVTLSAEAQQQWRHIRDIITSLPLVRVFDWRLPCVLDTDASQGHTGACLMQPHLEGGKSTLHPVAYFSKKFSDTQKRYSAQERELLGILLALQHWRHWVQGGEVTVVTDHESLKGLNTKAEQPPRIMRFLDAIQHYGIRILYRAGKANVLADYLSRPPTDVAIEPAFPADIALPAQSADEGRGGGREIKHAHELNRLDLQAIFEYLHQDAALPPAINPEWVRKHFVDYDDKLHKLVKYNRMPGDPPHPEGTSTNSTVLLQIPQYDELCRVARKTHFDFGHATVGSTTRQVAYRYWHPELVLAAQQAVAECPECQLMKKPDPALPDLNPITPPAPLTRWAIDFTTVGGVPILVAVEYATGWVEAEVTPDMTFNSTIPLMTRIVDTFGAPREWISDNAGCFTGEQASAWHRQHGSKVLPVTPARPRANGKVEKVNGDLKHTIVREWNTNPTRAINVSVRRAVMLYNRTPKPSGYSPYFLLFGTTPPSQSDVTSTLSFTSYIRDPTDQEEAEFERELVKQHEAPLARRQANSLQASRDRVRAYLQEKKALIRTYAPGDWVLRVRQRAHKHEPYYDGPWAIASCHTGNVYTLRSPGGITLQNKYNGTNLFPAYSTDGHPVRSLWYASKTMLERDRKRIEDSVRLGFGM